MKNDGQIGRKGNGAVTLARATVGSELARSCGVDFHADPLVFKIVGCGIEVHSKLGPGLLESVYERCLAHELTMQGLRFMRQVRVPVEYKGIQLDCGYRADFVIESRIVLELKAIEGLLPLHQAQVLTYTKLLNLKQGLLMNFNSQKLTDGLKSVIVKPA
jgi:GxxExxY protein